MNYLNNLRQLRKWSFLGIVMFLFSMALSLPSGAQTVVIGANNGTNASTTYPCPLADFYTSMRQQYLYKAADLAAQGIGPGSVITSLGWVAVATTNTSTNPMTLPAFQIALKNTSLTALSSVTWETGLTNVYGPASYTYAAGSATGPSGNIMFSVTPFVYAGGDLLIEVCNTDNPGTYSINPSLVWTTGLSYQASHTYRADNVQGCGTTVVTESGTVTTRPQLVVTYTPGSNCVDPPTPGTATASVSSLCTGQSVTLALTGNSFGATQTFTWQESASSGGTFTDISTPQTIPSITISPTQPRYYRCMVSCGTTSLPSTEVFVNVPAPFPAGNYTINNNLPTGGTNFNSFTAAVSAISCGIAGPIVFDVDPGSGPYTEQITLPPTINSNAVNTVTFNGNGRTLQFNSTNANARHIIKIDGADYITFNELIIDGSAAAATYAWGVHFINGADYNTFNLCTIKTSTTNITSGNHYPVVFSASVTSATTAGNTGNYNTFQDNTFLGGYYGVTVCGSGVGNEVTNNYFANNIIRDYYGYGIYNIYVKNGSYLSNDFSRPTRTNTTTTAGVYFTTSGAGNAVENNRIHDMFQAFIANNTSTMYGIFCAATGTVAQPTRIVNNAIYSINNNFYNGAIYGIYNSASANMNCWHNTISIDNPSQTAGLAYGVYQTGTAANVKVRNNIITLVRGGSGAKVGLYYATSASSISSNNNVIYVAGAGTGTRNIGNYAATNYATLASWQTANGGAYDANSVSANPAYTNPAAGDLTPTAVATNNVGANMGVAYDIIGTPRSTVAPDAGAWEYQLPGLDASLTWISPTSPTTAGMKTITVRVVNNLATTINSVTLNYTDGVNPPVTQTFSGLTLVGGGFQNFNFTTQYNLTASATLRAYISAVNGINDNNQANDSTNLVPLCLSLSGAYTINSAQPTGGSNFQSFTALAAALNCGGIAGPVTVNVVAGSGPYTNQVSFNVVTGGSAINTITINGNGNTLTYNGTGDYHTMRLNGIDYLTVNNLNIATSGTTQGIALLLSNQSDYNNFNNCSFTVPQAATSSTTSAVAFSASTTSPTTSGNNGNYNTFTGCTMSGGYYCVSVYGNTTAGGNILGNQFINCNITEFYVYGLYNAYAGLTVVKGCLIDRPTRATVSSGYGVYITTNSVNCLVQDNKVRKLFGGAPATTNYAYVIGCVATATAGNENKIINNVISDIQSNTGMYGLYLSGANFVQVYHNTVVFNDAASTSTNAAYGIYCSGTSGIDLRNNIVSVTRGGTASKYCLYYTSAAGVTSNNNDLYMNAGGTTNYIAYDGTTSYATLPAYQSGNPTKDQLSVSINPNFNNPAVFDYKPTEVTLNDLGTNVGVATDIAGVVRGAIPDMGAYEFSVAPTDIGIFSFNQPAAGGCYSASQDVQVTIKNFGSSPIDFSVNPVTVYCTVSGPVSATLNTTVSTGTLAPGSTMSVTIPSFNMTANGTYTFSGVYTAMPGDGNATNDNLLSNVTRVVGVIAGTISAPYTDFCISNPTVPTLTLSGSYGGSIQWKQSTVSASGPWTNVGSGTTTFVPTLTQTTYFQVEVSCNGNVANSNVLTINVISPTLTSTTPGSRCGYGSVTLGATASGAGVPSWYASATGGAPIGTGNTFITPPISTTTNFYVASAEGGSGTPMSLLTTTAAGNGSSGNLFDINVLNQIRIDSFSIAATSTGTASIYYRSGSGVGFNTSLAGWTLVGSAPLTVTGTLSVIPIFVNMILPPGTHSFILVSTGSVNYTNGSTLGNTYVADANVQIKEGYGGAGTSFTNVPRVWNGILYYSTAGCVGSRVPVTATVVAPPAITISNSAPVICAGQSSTLSVTSSNPAYTYTWMPGNLTGSSITPTVNASTVYTITATDNTAGTFAGCAVVDTTSVTANPNPTPVTVSASSNAICSGTNAVLTASGGIPAPATYCIPTYSTGTSLGDYCTLVSITGTTLNNPTAASASPYYTLYPATGSTTATLAGGTTYTIVLSAGTYTSNDFACWIDYNRDGVFDASEKLGEVDNVTSGPTTTSIVFTVPAGAFNGTTRLRVREADQATTGGMQPCNAETYGEVEDYIITVTGGINQGSFTWSPSTFLSSTTSNPTTATAMTTTTTYVATMTNGYGCSASGSATVLVNPTSSSSTSVTQCAPPYVWNGNTYTASGTYTFTSTGSNGCDSVATLNLVISPCNTTLNLTAFIQAYWDGTGAMNPTLFNQGQVNPVTDCDSITVELHQASVPTTVSYSTVAVLQTNGTATCIFPPVAAGYYYIVLKHRNSIETWSADSVSFPGGTVSYNFSTTASQAYGSNQIELTTANIPNGIFAIYSGDIVKDFGEATDLLDLNQLETEINNFSFGYFAEDLNGDGNVDILDSPALEGNISGFIYSNHP